MTKPADAPTVAAPIVELPPRDAAEAKERAARAANAQAFFAGFTLPPGTDADAVYRLIERHNGMVEAGDRFMLDLAKTGVIDRPRLRELLAAYGRSRRDLLTALGADPDSEDLLPLPVDLHHS